MTGSWTKLPYQVSRYEYGVPAAFTFEPNPTPHRPLTREQELDYAAQSAVHGLGTHSASYLGRLAFRVRYYRFFFLPPLYLALPFFVPALVELRFIRVAGTLLLFALGTNFYPYFYSHYMAAVTCLFVLVSVTALERLSRFSVEAAQLIFISRGSLPVLVSLQVTGRSTSVRDLGRDQLRRSAGTHRNHTRFADAPGKQLVFVRYGPRHGFEEWVHNRADIDASRVVWARDLGAVENEKLLRYYPDRAAWLLEPDARPPKLSLHARAP